MSQTKVGPRAGGAQNVLIFAETISQYECDGLSLRGNSREIDAHSPDSHSNASHSSQIVRLIEANTPAKVCKLTVHISIGTDKTSNK